MFRIILYLVLVVDISVLIYLAAGELSTWNRRRRQTQIQRVQQEIADTQQQLQSLAFRHDAWLRDQAHEARKALIMESFHASKKGQADRQDEPRCTNHNDV